MKLQNVPTKFSRILSLYLLLLINLDYVYGIGLKFIVEPQDTVVAIRGSGVLNCAARGAEGQQPKISWKKDGSLISFVGDTRSEEEESYFKRSILANGSLHITSLYRTREARPDEGMYQCLVSLDGVGSILSRSAKLQAASLSRFDEEPEDMSISPSQTARFSCSAQSIPPSPPLWLKDSVPLPLDSRMSLLPSGSLEIQRVSEGDSGTYACNLTNGDKWIRSKGGRLLVRKPDGVSSSPPVFTGVPKGGVVLSGGKVTLECSAVGSPVPKISWLKDGTTLEIGMPGSRFSLIGEGNLVINNIEEGDRGTYQCRAENHEDSADVSTTLDVHVPPKVLSTPSNFYAFEKEDIELPCKIYGKPMPTIQWFKNGDMIIEGDYFQIVNGNNLKILGCLASDTAMYQCFATNPSGNVQASVHLKVLKKGELLPHFPNYESLRLSDESFVLGDPLPPVPHLNSSFEPEPLTLRAPSISSHFVTLSWRGGLKNSLTRYSNFSVFYREEGSERERVLNTTSDENVIVQGLLPNKKYVFRVVGVDEKMGYGKSSSEIHLTTQPDVYVPSEPRFLKAVPVSSSRIDLSWAPPEVTNGKIERYTVYYGETSESSSSSGGGQESAADEEDYFIPSSNKPFNVTSTQAIIEELRTFTPYYVWVVPINAHGPGTQSSRVRVSTLGEAPSDTPHNVSAEPTSSTSIVVKWDPPPLEFRNGLITGYKIKYREKGKKRAETVTSDGNSRSLSIEQLERLTDYQIKIAALNVNGSGPSTEWLTARTFETDLDETQFPDKPSSLIARANADSITITWAPPLNSNVMVRGYTIGWGKGIPDVYNKLVDGKKRSFTIEKLMPNSEYVISLRASNTIGDGVPIYENVQTRESFGEDVEEEEEGGGTDLHEQISFRNNFPTGFNGGGGGSSSSNSLPPPTGLHVDILSPTSAVISWSDTSLPSSKSHSHSSSSRRYYTLRYTPSPLTHKSVYKTLNSSTLNLVVNNLVPDTLYEFSVRVVRGRLSSEWSLVASNRTSKSSTSISTNGGGGGEGGVSSSPEPFYFSAPMDLTILAMTGDDDESCKVVLNWQPPNLIKLSDLHGYFIYYTTNAESGEWVQESVSEDVLSHQISHLTPDTKYFFRMAAKLNRSLSPYSELKSLRTPPSKKSLEFERRRNSLQSSQDANYRSNQLFLCFLIGLSLFFAIGSVSFCIYYRKYRSEDDSPKQTTLKKSKKVELKPPDLWIHHDQMELKGVGGSEKGRRLTSPMSRSSTEFGEVDEKLPLQTTNSLERHPPSNYISSESGFESSGSVHYAYNSHSLGRRKPKPIKIPTEPFFINREKERSIDNNGIDEGRKRGEAKGYDTLLSGSSTASSQQNLNAYSANSDYTTTGSREMPLGTGSSLGTLGRRGSNLRSFTVPIPPQTPVSPPLKINMRGNGDASGGVCLKSPAPYAWNLNSNSSSGIGGGESYRNNYEGGGGGSTEDLSLEISNLEGLMKDLNAITASEFQC